MKSSFQGVNSQWDAAKISSVDRKWGQAVSYEVDTNRSTGVNMQF